MESNNPFKQFWQTSLRNKLIIIGVGLFILFMAVGLLSTGGQKSLKEGKETGKSIVQASTTPSPTQMPSPTSLPTPRSKLSPSPIPKPYDKNLGNNYIAAEFASKFMNIVDSAAPGYVTDVFVELYPEDLKGKSDEDYKKSLISVYLNVEVDSHLWSTTGEAGQKDLAASFLTSISNTFGGIPHVKITNGVRTVAEAEYPLFGGDPKITLK